MSLDIQAGPWSFELPVDWKASYEDPTAPYFEHTDGTWGCYIKVLEFGQSEAPRSPADLAAHIQVTHSESFESLPGAAWRVQAKAAASSAVSAESTVDYLDPQRTYRVVSHVRVAPPLGLHLTLHHYLCESYAHSAEYSAGILLSVRHEDAA